MPPMHAISRLSFSALLALANVSPAADTQDVVRPHRSGGTPAADAPRFIHPLADQKPAAKSKTAKIATGTFTGIEEGDYAHWQMRDAKGKELSFFILRPDASVDKVLENPKKFVGRKCRVKWKQSTENLPEAGGDTQIEQILSVEWVAE